MDNEELVPIDQVIEDMYNPDGGPVSWAARDYYYEHYATEQERIKMDREDRIGSVIAMIFWIAFVALFVYTVIETLAMY